MVCFICRENDVLLCHRCKSIMDYWISEMYGDMDIVARAQTGAELSEADFIRALTEYINIRVKEHDERRRCT